MPMIPPKMIGHLLLPNEANSPSIRPILNHLRMAEIYLIPATATEQKGTNNDHPQRYPHTC